jgi:hypothetical protein
VSVTFLPGKLHGVDLRHGADGEWRLIIHLDVDLGHNDALCVTLNLDKATVKRELLEKTLSITETDL